MTVKTTLTLWERLPLVPNTTTVKPLPPPPNELTLIVRMAVAVVDAGDADDGGCRRSRLYGE